MNRSANGFATAVLSMFCVMLLPLQGPSQGPLKRKIQPPRAGPTDEPDIQDFSITPSAVVKGSSAAIHWRVAPGSGGSP